MRVEGTQNLSRIEGVYVYPVRPYRTDAVPAVEPVKARSGDPDSSRIRENSLLELYTPKGMRRFGTDASSPSLIDRRA